MATRQKFVNNLRKQGEQEVQRLQDAVLHKLKKSVEIEKMPSVRVRPTLRVELKHRVMNCKMKGQQ